MVQTTNMSYNYYYYYILFGYSDVEERKEKQTSKQHNKSAKQKIEYKQTKLHKQKFSKPLTLCSLQSHGDLRTALNTCTKVGFQLSFRFLSVLTATSVNRNTYKYEYIRYEIYQINY